MEVQDDEGNAEKRDKDQDADEDEDKDVDEDKDDDDECKWASRTVGRENNHFVEKGEKVTGRGLV